MIKMYEHGGSANHGCEAIVRSTCAMLEKKPVLFSNSMEQDYGYHLQEICDINKNTDSDIKHGSCEWFVSAIETKLTGKYDLELKYRHKEMLHTVKRNDIWLSIGGDNYCYEGTSLIAGINKWVRKGGAKNVLWGCSVEPSILKDSDVRKDIAGFDLITARETISYEALKKVNSNVVLVSDPAFTLKKEELPLPEFWKEGDTIGINASPLILSNSDNADKVMVAYRNLILYILENTDSHIALVPHVVWKNNDDRIILNMFYQEFKDSKRVVLMKDCNCMQLKGYISRCRFFIGARTHATIAAYSTCVPTLVLGYSVKSRGIAKDIFGTDKNYVIPVQDLQDENGLLEGFLWIREREQEIREHLKLKMPGYIKNAYIAKEALEKLY